jgi:hypothetical protein
MARGRIFPDERDDELIIAVGLADALPGDSVTAVRELEHDAPPFRPRGLVIEDPHLWEIEQLVIGRFPQLAPGPIPAAMFANVGEGFEIELQTIMPSTLTEITARNISDAPARFRAKLVGFSVPGR